MNNHALRIVVVELLRPFVNENTTQTEFEKLLCNLASKSKLAKHWIQNLINPIFLVMLYIIGEREPDFGLHLLVCRNMIPYFFASGHWNYARDSIVYLRTMEKLPNSLMDKFIRGEHVAYLKDELFNGV